MGIKRRDIDWSDLGKLWGSKDLSIEQIARKKGVSRSLVKRVAKELGLPSRLGVMCSPKAHVRHRDPTPEEIAERCAALRAKRPARESEANRWEMPRYSYDRQTMSFRGV